MGRVGAEKRGIFRIKNETKGGEKEKKELTQRSSSGGYESVCSVGVRSLEEKSAETKFLVCILTMCVPVCVLCTSKTTRCLFSQYFSSLTIQDRDITTPR